MILFSGALGLGLEGRRDKKEAHPARVAGAGQGNIETVHEPKPIQAAVLLWGQGRRAMKDHHGPQTQVAEGAYAIKVSMRCLGVQASFIYPTDGRTDHPFCASSFANVTCVLRRATVAGRVLFLCSLLSHWMEHRLRPAFSVMTVLQLTKPTLRRPRRFLISEFQKK